MKPDFNASETDSDIFIAWYSGGIYAGGNTYRFCLNRTVIHPWVRTWVHDTIYTVDCKGTWFGDLTSVSDIRESVGPSIFSKLKFANVSFTIARNRQDNTGTIDTLIAEIQSSEGFTNDDIYAGIFISKRGQPIDTENDLIWVGVFEPGGCETTMSEITLKLIDPAKKIVEQNVLDLYEPVLYADIEPAWQRKEIPRLYGDWGDIGLGNHSQYGFGVPMINADDVHNDDATGYNWAIFRIGDFDGDFVMSYGSGIPQMAQFHAKVWAFWDSGTAYDIWIVRPCADQATYPIEDGYVEAVRSIREEIAAETVQAVTGVTLIGAARVKVHLFGGDPDPDAKGYLLIQEVVGTDELNQTWWNLHSKVNLGAGFWDIELNNKDGSATVASNFSAWVSGGISTTYVPIYKPNEPIGSRDTDTEPCRFWIQDGLDAHFYRDSVQNPGNPMENPVEIIYDLLVNVGGEDTNNFSANWWAVYADLETDSIKGRRYISAQTTIRQTIDEIDHDFGLMVYRHAGKWFVQKNRVWPLSSDDVDRSLSPSDYKQDTYSLQLDPGHESLRYDWGVRLYYRSDQEGQVFTADELHSIVGEQFSTTQDPLQSTDISPVPHLHEDKYYGTTIYPSVDYQNKSLIVESNWIDDDTTAALMCKMMAQALVPAMSYDDGVEPKPITGYGAHGVKAVIIKRTADPDYRTGSIYRFYNSSYYSRDIDTYGMVYERQINLKDLEVTEHCYEVDIT